MELKPLRKRILARRTGGAQTHTPGGLLIPQTSQDLGQEAIVLAVGSDVSDVSVNDEIMIAHYAGTDIKVGEEWLAIVREEDILGIVR